jgi:hypothetical protein
VDEMVDTHLINLALTSFGITAGVAILIAASIIGIAALRLRGKSTRTARTHTLTPANHEVITPAATHERQAA